MSRLASRVEKIAVVAEEMEFRKEQEWRKAEKGTTDKDVEGSEEESLDESDEEMK